MGYSIVVGVAMKAILNLVAVFIRMAYAHKEVESFSGRAYLKTVFIPLLLSTCLTLLIAYPLFHYSHGVWQKVASTMIVVISSVVFALFIGLTKNERSSLKNIVLKYLKRKK